MTTTGPYIVKEGTFRLCRKRHVFLKLGMENALHHRGREGAFKVGKKEDVLHLRRKENILHLPGREVVLNDLGTMICPKCDTPPRGQVRLLLPRKGKDILISPAWHVAAEKNGGSVYKRTWHLLESYYRQK